MVGKSGLMVKVEASLSRTVLPKALGHGEGKERVEGFTLPGMRQRQHFGKRTKKGKNKPQALAPGAS